MMITIKHKLKLSEPDYQIYDSESDRILACHKSILSKNDYFKNMISFNGEKSKTDQFDIMVLIINYLYKKDYLKSYLQINSINFNQMLNLLYYFDLIDIDKNDLCNNMAYLMIENLEEAHQFFNYKINDNIYWKINKILFDNIDKIPYNAIDYKLFNLQNDDKKFLFTYVKLMLCFKNPDLTFLSSQLSTLLTFDSNHSKMNMFKHYLIEKELKNTSDNNKKLFLKELRLSYYENENMRSSKYKNLSASITDEGLLSVKYEIIYKSIPLYRKIYGKNDTHRYGYKFIGLKCNQYIARHNARLIFDKRDINAIIVNYKRINDDFYSDEDDIYNSSFSAIEVQFGDDRLTTREFDFRSYFYEDLRISVHHTII